VVGTVVLYYNCMTLEKVLSPCTYFFLQIYHFISLSEYHVSPTSYSVQLQSQLLPLHVNVNS